MLLPVVGHSLMKGKTLARATSISLSKFTSTVQAAVAAAQQRNPKFALPAVEGIMVSSTIRGFPLPWPLAETLTVAEVQTFADDVAGHIGGVHPELFSTVAGSSSHGAVMSFGHHVICGIPPVTSAFLLEE
jgi:hypothetical protein